jgi:hypothetical protein
MCRDSIRVAKPTIFTILRGVEVPHAYLALSTPTGKSVLYLPPRKQWYEETEGPNISDQDGSFVVDRT